MAKTNKFTQDQVIAALVASKGMVYVAARRLQVTAKTIYHYVNRYPKVKEAMQEERGKMVDIGEMKLYENVVAGDQKAIEFLLLMLGRDRGYRSRQELSGIDGEPLTIRVRYAKEEGFDHYLPPVKPPKASKGRKTST
jgi:hypothetical protein